MNIKERLKTSKKAVSNVNKSKIGKYKNTENYFVDGKYVQNLIRTYIKNSKNIIFIVNNSFDTELISLYFKSFVDESDKKISENKLQIISEPSITEIVKIFENIISLDCSYIFGLKINKPDNIYEKLSTLIAVNFTNLQKQNIDILIGSSDAVLVYFDKNKEGLYYIYKIEEIVNTEQTISFEKIYDDELSYILSSDENVENSVNETDDNQQTPLIIVNNTKPKKVNKYKLLKEKIKRKKEINQ